MPTEETAVTVEPTLLPPGQFSKEKIELIKRTVAKGTSDLEFAWFLENCRAMGLDPLRKQIYCIKRKGEMTIQIGIDGFRVQAHRTGEYRGRTKPEWCDRNGKWTFVWTAGGKPWAARIGVMRKDFLEPLYATVHYAEFQQAGPSWDKMPCNQIIKCAEAAALRAAFPAELSGFYTPEELPPDEPPTPEQPKTTAWQIRMFPYFARAKESLGDEAYYRILGAHGYEHCNEIKSRDEAGMIWKEMEQQAGEINVEQPGTEPDNAAATDDDKW